MRLNAEQDNPLAAWSWAIGTGNAGTAFAILAGFAPSKVWVNYPLLLPGSAAPEPPGAEEHRGYPLALAVSALFASIRADVTGAEKLWRRAAEPLTIGQPPQAREYGPGGTFWSPGKGLHRMDHQAGAVTIHVYWPPARAIGLYDLQRGQLPVPTACTTSHPALYQALHPPAAGDRPATHGGRVNAAVADVTQAPVSRYVIALDRGDAHAPADPSERPARFAAGLVLHADRADR